jgi:hypothetical protein
MQAFTAILRWVAIVQYAQLSDEAVSPSAARLHTRDDWGADDSRAARSLQHDIVTVNSQQRRGRAPSHLRFSSAYAWNTSALHASSFNLAQAKSVQAAAAFAERGIPSALAAFQGPVFVRTTGAVRLSDDWEAEVDKLASAMRHYVRPGAIEAIFLGDEVCCHSPRCLNATLAPVARKLRGYFPDRSSLLIWTNECDSSIIGGVGHDGAVILPLPNTSGAIPREIDVLSVDRYSGFGNDTLPGSAEVTDISNFFASEVFPRMHTHQVAMAVPGLFGCASCIATGCGSLAAQESRLRDKLHAYINYLRAETRMVGLAPWHLNDRHSVQCNVVTKSKCHDCEMRLGAEAFPQLLAEWLSFGASIVRSSR